MRWNNAFSAGRDSPTSPRSPRPYAALRDRATSARAVAVEDAVQRRAGLFGAQQCGASSMLLRQPCMLEAPCLNLDVAPSSDSFSVMGALR